MVRRQSKYAVLKNQAVEQTSRNFILHHIEVLARGSKQSGTCTKLYHLVDYCNIFACCCFDVIVDFQGLIVHRIVLIVHQIELIVHE